MSFKEYLISKKIDASAFEKAEPTLFFSWNSEFDQMHSNSFTTQKLNLINPIRRKYQLKEVPTVAAPATETTSAPETKPVSSTTTQPRVARPVIKPKIN